MLLQSMPYPSGQAIADDIAVGDGAWCWLSDPRAISVNGEPVVGAISSVGDLLAYDADATPTSVDLHGSTFQQDDHASPTFLVRSSDSRILVFASMHNGSTINRYLSSSANDPSAFGAASSLDASLGLNFYTYPSVVQLTGETNHPIYLSFRADDGTNRHYYYSASTNQGVTWAAATKLLSNNGDDSNFPPYVKVIQNGNDRIDYFCTDGSPLHTPTNSFYHFYYEGGSFRETDGTPLTLPILPATDLTPIYDGSSGPVYPYDAATDGSGNPVGLYSLIDDEGNHKYHRAIWDGATWDDTEICEAGGFLFSGSFYSGGLAIDPDDTDTVFASRQIGGEWKIFRYTTPDGIAWTGEQITDGVKDMRPYVIRGQAEPRLIYFTGRYDNYIDYDTDIILIDSRKSATVTTGHLLIEGGTDSLLIEGGTDTLLVEEVTYG